MSDWFKRYQHGFHQEVYDEMLTLQEQVCEPALYEEAFLVMRTLMQRVRANIEQLVSRLEQLGYHFLEKEDGKFASLSADQSVQRRQQPFQPPSTEVHEQVALLKALAGPLPLSLVCWYEEVGTVNLVGLFPGQSRQDGPKLDPLYILPIEEVLQQVSSLKRLNLWDEEPSLILAPDQYHKYGYSGAGSYRMLLPCKQVDTLLLDEPHNTTFVNYLRTCLRWGGLPGLEVENRLPAGILEYLTEGLMPF
jgi:hypothetical protein